MHNMIPTTQETQTTLDTKRSTKTWGLTPREVQGRKICDTRRQDLNCILRDLRHMPLADQDLITNPEHVSSPRI
jgi:hypothetical protein